MTTETLKKINELPAAGVRQTDLSKSFGIGSYNTFVQRLARAGYEIAPQLVPLRTVPIAIANTGEALDAVSK